MWNDIRIRNQKCWKPEHLQIKSRELAELLKANAVRKEMF